ncbi:MAG: diguanylate cyclase, partial [Myxococcales bacterium]|nr:diguanylate cyclase [Myxococcales bacterium]
VARVGGDEFAVLGVECDGAGATRLQGRVRRALAAAQIEASIGLAQRDPGSGLGAAVREADSAMYQAKRARCSASPEAR